MFSTMFKSLFDNGNKQNNESENQIVNNAYRKEIESKLTELNEIGNALNENYSQTNQHDIIDALEVVSIADTNSYDDIDVGSVDNFDDSKSEISSIGEINVYTQTNKKVDPDSKTLKTINRINSLQCLFTWNLKANNRKNLILMIQKKYGEYNLDISLPEFTFQRYIIFLTYNFNVYLQFINYTIT